MATDYKGLAALMNDAVFLGRVKVACLHFATSINGEDAGTPAHNTRFKWSQSCFQNPDQVAFQITPIVTQDANVINSGAAIDDPGLQTAVEYAVQKTF